MAVWVVRQSEPKGGAWDKIALENGVVVIDFGLETDISNFRDRRAMEDYLRQNAHALYGYRSGPPRRVRHAAGQVWRFYHCIEPGDLAVYHVWKHERLVRVGEFLDGGAYQKEFPDYDYVGGWRREQPERVLFQVRPVCWLAEDIPMSAFNPGLHLDAPGTVYKPRYVDADAHVREVLQKHRNTGSS